MENLKSVLLFVCISLCSGSSGDSPTLDRWLSVFFRELDRNISPEVLEESVIRNKDKLVLIQYPESIKATFPLGVRLPSQSVCSDGGESVAFATDITPTQSFSVFCMRVEDYRAFPLGGHAPTPKETYEKSLALLLKLYPDIKVALPFTSDEIHSYLKEREQETKRVSDLEERIMDIQNRENYLSRTIPSLDNLYERASKSLTEEEEDEVILSSYIFSESEKTDEEAPWNEKGFDDPFFSEDDWSKMGGEDTSPDSRSREGTSQKMTDNVTIKENDEANNGEIQDDNLVTESSLDSIFEVDDDTDKAPYKTKYETVLGILLTILAVVAIIVLLYIYRRQQRSRVFQVSGQSTPSSRVSPNEHNIFEPQILQLSKDDPECSFGGTEQTATIKTGNLLAVKVASSRHSSVSSTRSNPFLGTDHEIPKIPGPPTTTPNTPTSRTSTNSFAPQN